MYISDNGIGFIQGFEGFGAQPYRCPAGVPTIGYGATHYADGTAVTLSDAPITRAAARALLKAELHPYERAVNRAVVRTLNQNRFDALVSFAFNVGVENFKRSGLLKKVNKDPEDSSITHAFKCWVYAGGQLLRGLQNRRAAEAKLYFTPCG